MFQRFKIKLSEIIIILVEKLYLFNLILYYMNINNKIFIKKKFESLKVD